MTKKGLMAAVLGCALTGVVSSLATILAMHGTQDAYASSVRIQDDTVKTKQLLLLSHDGKLAGVWSTGKKDNLPCLMMVDRDQKVRVTLALTGDGSPAFGFTDQNEKSRIGFAITKDGDPVVTLMNKKGDASAAISVENDEGILLLNGHRKKE